MTIQIKPLEQYFHKVQIWPSNIKQDEIQNFCLTLNLLGSERGATAGLAVFLLITFFLLHTRGPVSPGGPGGPGVPAYP